MTAPIVFISHFKIKEGALASLKQLSQEVTEFIKTNKPGTVAFLQFFNEENTELSIVHLFPDADSFDRHVEGATERAQRAMEFIVPTRREIYGTPSDQVMASLTPPEGSGIEMRVMPYFTGGYMRFKPE